MAPEIGHMARLLAAECGMTVERPNTLAGLVEKRAEIAGQISHTRATLRQLIIDLDHVDARFAFSIRATMSKASARRSRAPRTGQSGAT
jgi:hypothetical protein